MKDVAFRAAPLGSRTAHSMIGEIRSYPLLLGVRGEKRKDIDAIADVAQGVNDMNSYIIASTRKNAGKTSLLAGIARASGKRFGYLKPLGDRFLYRKKRLWDYDASLLVRLFGLDEEPEAVSIGFDHSKLRYMYDRDSITAKLKELIDTVGKDKEALFIEALARDRDEGRDRRRRGGGRDRR